MRPYLLLILVILSGAVNAQQREKRDVGAFSKIAYRIPGKMHLKSGNATSVEVSGPAEILAKLETRVESGKLVIEPENPKSWKNRGDFDQVHVYVTVSKLSGLAVAGSGKVIGEGTFSSSTLDLDMAGSGSIQMDVDAGAINADLSGSGQVLISGKIGGLNADVAGSGLIETGEITGGEVRAEIAGSGTLRLHGKAAALRVTIAGSGDISGFDLEAKESRIKIAGSGNVETRVTDALDVEIAGSGSVSYKGNPARLNQHVNGSGKVRYAPEL